MEWWLWVLIGLALLAAEMLTPGGFYILFFGVGALAVGALVAFDLGGSPVSQGLIFSLGSVAALGLFRRRLRDLLRARDAGHEVDSLRGEVAILLDDLPSGGVGRGELRGTSWTVRSATGQSLAAGQRCRVERIDGLTLWVSPE